MAVISFFLIHFGKLYFTVNTAVACNALSEFEYAGTWLTLSNHWAYEILPFCIWCTAPLQAYMLYRWDHSDEPSAG
jgi:hypothetical protein